MTLKTQRHVSPPPLPPVQVAVKVIDKHKLDPVARAHLFQEVRCMKMVQHPNVVRLYEVIDTATKLYLILELGDGGDMYDCIMKYDGGLAEEVRGIVGGGPSSGRWRFAPTRQARGPLSN